MSDTFQTSMKEAPKHAQTCMAASQGPGKTISLDRPPWSVWRQDDNGNIALSKSGLTKTEAVRLVEEYEAKEHKQTYWAQESQ